MYQEYFGLSEPPFSIAPDPRYLFLSNKHREALAHLIYGVGDQGGFVVLTGEVGTGKTTICRCLLQQVPENADIAYIINPRQSVNQLLQSIFSDLTISYPEGSTSKDLIDLLNHHLLDAHARGRNIIVIIDEAQNLTSDVLEQLRLLTNLETNEKKLLQLVLLGQPELNTLLSKPELRQLSQRVTARYHLSPLSRSEVAEYIGHRLSVAGCRVPLFSAAAIRKVYKLSQGVPRLINLICDRALLGVYATNSEQVTPIIVAKAAKEVFNNSFSIKRKRRWIPVVAAACLGATIFTITYIWKNTLSSTRLLEESVGLNLNQLLQENPPQAIHPVNSMQAASKNKTIGWLQRLHYYDDAETALMELYQLWRLSPGDADVRSCLEPARDTLDIYCRQAINTVSQLRTYNSPVVLSYKLGGGRYGHLLVSQLSGNTATVKIGTEQFSVPVQELFNQQFSHSYLLTRIPEGIELPIFPEDSGVAIQWLQLMLARHYHSSSLLKKKELKNKELQNTVSQKGLQGKQIVDDKIDAGRNKFDFLYQHYLDFSDVLIGDKYDKTLQQQVTQLQENLGMVGNAIVDIALLVALNKDAYKSDPSLVREQPYPDMDNHTIEDSLGTDNIIDDSLAEPLRVVREG